MLFRSPFFCTLIVILILQAIAYQHSGDQDQADTKLAEAVRLAAEECSRRVFLEESPLVGRMLARIHPVAPDFIDQLLKNFASQSQSLTAPAFRLPEILTPREVEVLHLMAAGLRNQEIANRLVISVATVKRHISNINGKLGVEHRAQAILRARELKLI